jgi:hypothetical protein
MCLNDCVLPEDVLNEAEQASNSLIPEKSKGRSGQVRSGQVRSGQVRSFFLLFPEDDEFTVLFWSASSGRPCIVEEKSCLQ